MTADERVALGLVELAQLEGQLRVGLAHESLAKVRDFLGLKDSLTRAKRSHIRGYEKVTRSEESIKRAQRLLDQAAVEYRRSYHALERLDWSFAMGTEAGPLKKLKDSDLVHLSHWTEEQRFNKSDEVSWIWRIAGQAGDDVSEESWATEGKCGWQLRAVLY